MTNAAVAKPQTLDELMLAMDVVDTIRHRELIVERELGQGDRDDALRTRLREIYKTQGIEVSGAAIYQGIKALKESRFAYAPPAPGLARSLALIWVSRKRIGKWAAAIVFATAALWGTIQYGYVVPARQATENALIELTQTLPAELQSAYNAARIEARVEEAINSAESLKRDGSSAIAGKNAAGARDAIAALQTLRTQLIQTYRLIVVSRSGASSGVWRVPDGNSSARNYYVIVEAIAPGGQTLDLPVTSEETGRTKTVSAWGIRVPESFFDAIKRDKQDNGIIENNTIGEKHRGELKPRLVFPAEGGAITSWDE